MKMAPVHGLTHVADAGRLVGGAVEAGTVKGDEEQGGGPGDASVVTHTDDVRVDGGDGALHRVEIDVGRILDGLFSQGVFSEQYLR